MPTDPLLRLYLFRLGLSDHVAQRDSRSAFDQFSNDDAACAYSELRRERAAAAKMSQNSHVVINNGEKNFRRQVLAISSRKIDRPALGRVIDHVHHEAHEAIYE